MAATASDSQGRFAFQDLVPGDYRIVARDAGGAVAVRQVEVPVDGACVGVTLHLPTKTYEIRGRLRYADGRPWVGEVRVSPRTCCGWLPGDVPPVRTGDDGRFVLPGVPTGRTCVHAWRDGTLDVAGPRIWVPPEDEVEIVVDRDFVRVSGRVLSDENHRPVAGAFVEIRDSDIWLGTRTDEEGRFGAAAPRGESSGLTHVVRARGFATACQTTLPVAREVVVLLSRSGRLRGRVVEEGTAKPVRGIDVLLRSTHPQLRYGAGWRGRTGRDGAFDIADVPSGLVSVGAQGRGWLSLGPDGELGERVEVEVGRGRTVQVELTVRQAATQAGVVRGPKGEPVAGARVGTHDDAHIVDAVSAADGRFALEGLHAGRSYEVRASHPRYCMAFVDIEVPQAENPSDLEIRLGEERQLRVRVLDEQGAPLHPAEVWVAARGMVEATRAVAEDGTCHFRGLPPGRLDVVALAPRRLRNSAFVEKDRRQGAVEVRLAKAGTIAGRVTFWAGEPGSGAYVSLPGGGASTHADADGRFELRNVSPGRQKIQAHLARWRFDRATETVRAGDQDVVLRLPRRAPPSDPKAKPGAVVLRVFDAEGAPVPKAAVSYAGPDDPDRYFWRRVEGGIALLRADSVRFTVANARSASGALLPVGPVHHGPVPPATDELEVRLPPELAVEGVVLDDQGRGVPRVGIEVNDERTHYLRDALTTDDRGRFRIGQLAAGPCTFDVRPPGGYLPRDGVVVEAGSSGVEIRLERALRATIVVLGPGGEPLADASVHVGWPFSFGPCSELRTDGAGRVRHLSLAPGDTYVVAVFPPEARTDLRALRVPAWRARANATFRLAHGLRLAGRVVDPEGRGVARARVRIEERPKLDRSQSADTDAAGNFELLGLLPGRGKLVASLDFKPWHSGPKVLGWPESAPVEVAAGATGVELVLDPGLPLVVRVSAWPATAEAEVRCSLFTRFAWPDGAERDDVEAYSAPVDRQGVARFRHAPRAATYDLWIGPVAGNRYALVRGIRGGESETRVPLRIGGRIEGRLVAPEIDCRYSATLTQGLVSVSAKADPDGRFVFPAVPAGVWELTGRATERAEPQRQFRGRTQARAGDQVELPLTPQVSR